MKATINLHDVIAIRVGEMQQLSGETHSRDIEIETADGDVFVVAAYTRGESAEIDVADRESPEEYTGSAYSLKEALDRSMPDGVQKHGDGWIRHDGGECPVHPMDVIRVCTDRWPEGSPRSITAWKVNWGPITYYRPLLYEDGVPYCSADGLEDWADYIASDDDGRPFQFGGTPKKRSDGLGEYWGDGALSRAPSYFANTRQHWTKTLRRVWRQ